MKKSADLYQSGRPVRFIPNLLYGILAGAYVGVLIGLVFGLKTAKINPSITAPADVWLLATHFGLIYLVFGLIAGAIVSLALFPFFRRKGLKAAGSLFGFYLPVMFVLGFLYYVRSYVLTHFIINPLMPIKGGGWISLFLTLVFIALAYFIIKVILRIISRWKIPAIASVFAVFLVIGWTLLGIFPPDVNSLDIPQFEEYSVQPSGAKVALIGIDGAWWKIIDPLLEKGELPNFQRLISGGVRSDLKTLYPTFSAMIWTSVVTGKLPQKHGINSFLVWTFPLTGAHIPIFRLPQMAPELLWVQENIATVAPIPSNYRTASSLWNILTDKDSGVGIINWWASWPAEPVNGYLYTDHALFNKLDVLTNYKDREGTSQYDIYPPELILELQQFTYTPEDITYEDLTRFVKVESDAFWQEFQELNTYDYLDIAYEASMFKFSFPGDKTVIEAANYLLEKNEQPDLWAIYIQGIDALSHQYLKYHFPENYDKLIPENIARYSGLITNYYKYMDEALGRFLDNLDPNTIVMLVSDHGFDEGMLPTGHYHHVMSAAPNESQEFHLTDIHKGIFVCSGPGIKQNGQIDDISVLDIAPTILAALGYPYADDMDGRIVSELFDTPPQVETIPTYDKDIKRDRTIIETGMDKEVRDKLKALGYVK